MNKKDPRPPRAPWLSPYLISPDVKKIADFYQKAFGFKLEELAENEEGQAAHAEFWHEGALIMVGLEGEHAGPMRAPASTKTESPICLCLYVRDVDQFFAKAINHGAKVVFPPADMFWGDRACCVVDPDGYSWTFCTYLKGKKPAQHEHGDGCCGGHH